MEQRRETIHEARGAFDVVILHNAGISRRSGGSRCCARRDSPRRAFTANRFVSYFTTSHFSFTMRRDGG